MWTARTARSAQIPDVAWPQLRPTGFLLLWPRAAVLSDCILRVGRAVPADCGCLQQPSLDYVIGHIVIVPHRDFMGLRYPGGWLISMRQKKYNFDERCHCEGVKPEAISHC